MVEVPGSNPGGPTIYPPLPPLGCFGLAPMSAVTCVLQTSEVAD